MILGRSRKRWKNDAKRNLKSHVFLSKMSTWPPRFDLSIDFWRFGAIPKNYYFSKSPRWSKQTKNIGPNNAKKHHSRERVGTYAGRGPWGGQARDQKEEKGEKERSQLKSLKGKVEILESFKGLGGMGVCGNHWKSVRKTPVSWPYYFFENFEKSSFRALGVESPHGGAIDPKEEVRREGISP